jgi:hypothetical protein
MTCSPSEARLPSPSRTASARQSTPPLVIPCDSSVKIARRHSRRRQHERSHLVYFQRERRSYLFVAHQYMLVTVSNEQNSNYYIYRLMSDRRFATGAESAPGAIGARGGTLGCSYPAPVAKADTTPPPDSQNKGKRRG